MFTLKAKVIEVMSASKYSDNVQRIKLKFDAGESYNREIVIQNTDKLQLDSEVIFVCKVLSGSESEAVKLIVDRFEGRQPVQVPPPELSQSIEEDLKALIEPVLDAGIPPRSLMEANNNG